MIVHKVEIGQIGRNERADRAHKKIYVGGAESDVRYRDMLVFGRHRWEFYTNPTIDFLTFDRNENENLAEAKTAIESCIRKADGVMIIVTQNTNRDPLALMEIEIATSHNIPVVGIHINKNQKDAIPEKLVNNMTTYGWEWFAEFINSL